MIPLMIQGFYGKKFMFGSNSLVGASTSMDAGLRESLWGQKHYRILSAIISCLHPGTQMVEKSSVDIHSINLKPHGVLQLGFM